MLSRLVCRRKSGANGSRKVDSSGKGSGEALGTRVLFMFPLYHKTNKVVLERRSRNRMEEVDRISQGWLAQEKRTCKEKEHATITLAATSRAFRARRADCEQDSQGQIVCVFASPPARIVE